MAVLVGVLMGVGQLAADHEITAMKASGISLMSVLKPLLLGAAFVTLGLIAYNHFVFPESNHTLANLLHDINRKKPMMEIRERMFTELGGNMTIYVRKKDDRTGRMEDVSIFEREEPGDAFPRLTTAEWGLVIPDHENDAMLIELHDGEIHDVPDQDQPDKYQVVRFRRHDIFIGDAERDLQESERSARGDREMNLVQLWNAAHDEREKQTKVAAHVDNLGRDLAQFEDKLLRPTDRARLIGTDAGRRDGHNAAYRVAGFTSTRNKVDLAASQSRYQDKVRQSYRVRESRYLVEIHKKLAIPLACLVFVLLGIPMAVNTSRSGRGVSVSLALAVYLVYYLFLVGGEKFADRGRLDPAVAMWSANVVLTLIGIPVFWKTVHEGAWFGLSFRSASRRRRRAASPDSADPAGGGGDPS
jgi:lipopolysaccharide export system permease protein